MATDIEATDASDEVRALDASQEEVTPRHQAPGVKADPDCGGPAEQVEVRCNADEPPDAEVAPDERGDCDPDAGSGEIGAEAATSTLLAVANTASALTELLSVVLADAGVPGRLHVTEPAGLPPSTESGGPTKSTKFTKSTGSGGVGGVGGVEAGEGASAGRASAAEGAAHPIEALLTAVVDDPSVSGRLRVTGPADVLPGLFRVTAAAATAVAAAAVGAGRLSAARTGEPEPAVTVDTRHVAVAFRSERYITANRLPLPSPWDPLSGLYRTRDGRWVQLNCDLPHHQNGVLAILRAPRDRAQVERVVSRLDADVLEGELQAMGMCAAMVRSEEEWRAHPQGRALAELPLIEVEKLDDAPVRELNPSSRPAGGVRVLDMTRIIAGPVCGRVLAAYGATVLRVGATHLPEVPALVIDTGFGKRNTNVDLRGQPGVRRMRELVAGADVVVQAYRPKALDRLGFGPAELARIRPGIVCVTITAYGRLGPWSGLRGFDSLVQTASGIAHAGGMTRGVDRPVPLPAQALGHATGYLTAYGAMATLARRQREGGSWHVRLSLAQTGRWLQGLGRSDAPDVADLDDDDVEPWLGAMPSELGMLHYVRPPGALASYTPAWWTPPVPLGSSPPAWPSA